MQKGTEKIDKIKDLAVQHHRKDLKTLSRQKQI